MKYLKTYEELSPEYLVGKAGNRNTPQEQRIGTAADNMINQRNQEENYKKKKAEEEERLDPLLKDPIYKQNKELSQKRYSLAKEFSDEKLNFYFTSEEIEGCFLNRVEFIIGELANNKYNLWDWYDLELGFDEKHQPFIGRFNTADEIDSPSFQGVWSKNYNIHIGSIATSFNNFEKEEAPFEIMINKEGIIILKKSIENDFKATYYESWQGYNDGESKKFEGVKLVGMDLVSKNKLANFIKQYIPEATCGNGKLKVNGIEMPVLEKDFTEENCKPLQLKSDI
jgi:hypothetical protein